VGELKYLVEFVLPLIASCGSRRSRTGHNRLAAPQRDLPLYTVESAPRNTEYKLQLSSPAPALCHPIVECACFCVQRAHD
jgi:hypothetical protein